MCAFFYELSGVTRRPTPALLGSQRGNVVATIEELREQLGDKVVDRVLEAVSADGPEWYRKELAELGGAKKENEQLKAKLNQIERTPQIESAFREKGVAWDDLRPAERKAIEAFDGDLSDAEAVSRFISDNEFPTASQEQGSASGGSEAAAISNFATASTSAPTNKSFESAIKEATNEKDALAIMRQYGVAVIDD